MDDYPEVYQEGVDAFNNGLGEDDCPYPFGPNVPNGTKAKRVSWFNGYFDTRTGDKLKEVFERNNIQWP